MHSLRRASPLLAASFAIGGTFFYRDHLKKQEIIRLQAINDKSIETRSAIIPTLKAGSSDLAAVVAVSDDAQAPATDRKQRLTLVDLLSLRVVTWCAISGDGNKLAFTVITPSSLPVSTQQAQQQLQQQQQEEVAVAEKSMNHSSDSINKYVEKSQTRGRVELFVADVNSDLTSLQNMRVLVSDEWTNPSNVVWSADSSKLYFLAKRGNNKNSLVYAIAVDGGEALPLVNVPHSIRAFSVSACGKKLVYTYSAPLSQQAKADNERGFKQIVMDAPRPKIRARVIDLTNFESQILKLPKNLQYPWGPQFDPTGKKIAMWVSPSSSMDDKVMNRELAVVDTESNEFRIVSPPSFRDFRWGKVGDFCFSNDGNEIALLATHDRSDANPGAIFVCSVAFSGEKKLISYKLDLGCENADPMFFSWSKNNAKIMHVVLAEGVLRSLNAYSIPNNNIGENFREIVKPDRKILISASENSPIIRSFSSCNKSNIFAIKADSSRHPPEVWLFNTNNNSFFRSTDSNQWLRKKELSNQQIIRFPARDGLIIEAIYIPPLIKSKTGKSPLIIQVHGGPESHVPNGWVSSYSIPGQVAAGMGFAVAIPNYRGSTGRGRDFLSASQRGDGYRAAGIRYEEKEDEVCEFNDLVDLKTFLVENRQVDPQRVGIAGTSYGGYAASWSATKLSEHYAAAAALVGIHDQVSKIFTTDIPTEAIAAHWGNISASASRRNNLAAKSPISHVANCRTPLLLGHGQIDNRVPTSQSHELYHALKMQGGAFGGVQKGVFEPLVRLVLYPGQGHGNTSIPSRLDFGLRLLEWMVFYLQPEVEQGAFEARKTLPPPVIDYEKALKDHVNAINPER